MITNLSPLIRIVDDEESVRRSECFIFKIAHIDCAEFESAEELLAKDDFRRPGCIVLDLRMEGMNGLELQQKLKELGCDLPIVFLSGHGTINTAVFALKAGAADFLEKPVKPEALLKIVRQLIEKNLREHEAKARRFVLREKYETLTDREKDVLQQVATGATNKVIAGNLGIAEQTVKIHRGSAMYKLGIHTAVDAYETLSTLGISVKKAAE